jgi:hypothetical protein
VSSPAFRSAIIKWPKSLRVTIEINPEQIATGQTVGTVGLRLAHIGGKFLEWRPNVERRPAMARFEFSSLRERAQFVAEIARIPGVSIIARSE